jgi:small subunit ribosomal protein S16
MRMGKKKQPTYRVVAADSRSPRNGRFIEIVGIYDPRPDPSAIRIDNDKAVDWLRKGAQPTESVRKLLEISGAWETFSGQPSTRPAPAPKAKAAPAPAAEPTAEPSADEAATEADETAAAGVEAGAEGEGEAPEPTEGSESTESAEGSA